MYKDGILPIGSVVQMGEYKFMIIGYMPVNEDGLIREYMACIYPNGLLQFKSFITINSDEIDSVFYVGSKTKDYDLKFANYKKAIDIVSKGIDDKTKSIVDLCVMKSQGKNVEEMIEAIDKKYNSVDVG